MVDINLVKEHEFDDEQRDMPLFENAKEITKLLYSSPTKFDLGHLDLAGCDYRQ